MKKEIAVLFTTTVALALTGCSNTETETQITQESVATTNAAGVLEIEQSTQEETSVETVEETSTQEETVTEVQTELQETTETEAAEYGFHVIDLYSEGFMDCLTQEAADYYLTDGIHPNDMGNIALGEHIAAELSLYFGQKEE